MNPVKKWKVPKGIRKARMKNIQVKNPSQRLLAIMTVMSKTYVRTCHSDTCSCFSHDSGYALLTGEVPDEVEVQEVGGSVHSHPTTIRVDDPEGGLQLHLSHLRQQAKHASPGASCSRAGARFADGIDREIRVSRRALEMVRLGSNLASAEAKAESEEKASEAQARREKRARALEIGIAAGLTTQEASTLYGAGHWCQEVDWASVKVQITRDRRGWQQRLSEALVASSSRALDAQVGDLFSGSFPRRRAWCQYALTAFFGGHALPATGRDYPVKGKGWNFIPA